MKKTIPAVLLCVLTAAFLVACAAPASAPMASSAPPGTAEVTAPSATAAYIPSGTPAATATAGVTENRLGYVTDAYVSGGTNTIKIDYVDMYTGEEAVEKALADGSDVVEKDENGNYFVLNDYYIRNVNKKVRTFPLAPGCTIGVLGHDDPSIIQNVTFSEFRTRLIENPLMHVKLVNGSVVSMIQQFIP